MGTRKGRGTGIRKLGWLTPLPQKAKDSSGTNGVHDVLGPVLEGIDSCVRFPSCAVRSVVAAVDGLDHAVVRRGQRGSHDGNPRERVRPTVVRLWPSSSRPRNLEPKRTMAVCAVSPAACDRVSARRSKRRAWTCLAVTCVGEGAPGASRVARSAEGRGTPTCVRGFSVRKGLGGRIRTPKHDVRISWMSGG